VIAAAFGVPREKVADLVAERRKNPFADKAAFIAAAQRSNLISAIDLVDVKSSWFSVRIQVAQDDVVLGSEALVRRDPKGAAIIWRRTRY